MNGMPSVLNEPLIDDDVIHIETLKSFLVSSTGLAAKRFNPGGYANAVAHMQLHLIQLQSTIPSKPDQESENPELEKEEENDNLEE